MNTLPGESDAWSDSMLVKQMFKGLSGVLTLWLAVIFVFVAFVGWHQLRDISTIHTMAVNIEQSNHESHHLHDLEMRVREMVAHAHDYLITGSLSYVRKFNQMASKVERAIAESDITKDQQDIISNHLAKMKDTGERIFSLSFATGNMEGPILMQELDHELQLLSGFLSTKHHKMDESVNQAMLMVGGLQMDLREDFQASMVVLFLLLVGLSVYLYRRIVQPLVQLQAGVRKIGEGDFTPMDVDFGDNEIGELAQALDFMEAALQKRTAELDQAKSFAAHRDKMHALGLMTASIAHEVGNPLSAAAVALDVCKRKLNKGDAGQAEPYLESVAGELRRTENIIRNVLDFGRQSDQQQCVSDIREIIENAIRLVRLSRQAKSIGFNVVLPEQGPDCLNVPEDVIRQVLVNLLLNGIDASRSGQEITVKASYDQQRYYLDVMDQGAGVPPDIATSIFSPLFTTKGKGKGTGLGLSISRDLMRRSNGDIELLQKDTPGCCFRVSVPLGQEM